MTSEMTDAELIADLLEPLDPGRQTRRAAADRLQALASHSQGGEPLFWALWSVSGVHIGTWKDRSIAERVFRDEYPDGKLMGLYAAEVDEAAQLPARPVVKGEMVERMCKTPVIEDFTPTRDEWERCETVGDQYDLMKRRIRMGMARLSALEGEGW